MNATAPAAKGFSDLANHHGSHGIVERPTVHQRDFVTKLSQNETEMKEAMYLLGNGQPCTYNICKAMRCVSFSS